MNEIADRYFEMAHTELMSNRDDALWYKCIALTKGDDAAARAKYIEIRAKRASGEHGVTPVVPDTAGPLAGAETSPDYPGTRVTVLYLPQQYTILRTYLEYAVLGGTLILAARTFWHGAIPVGLATGYFFWVAFGLSQLVNRRLWGWKRWPAWVLIWLLLLFQSMFTNVLAPILRDGILSL